MYVIENYTVAVLFCVVTMISWGSSSNAQKLVSSTWRTELYCWDYVIGILLTSLIFALTIGNHGIAGRGFVVDIRQADISSITSALLGGVIFNIANVLFIAAVSIAGISVAFSLGSGLSLIIGVFINYLDNPVGDVYPLFCGVLLIVIAILLNTIAYKRMANEPASNSTKGLLITIASGVLMGLFFKYVANSMFPDFTNPLKGKLSPYSAIFVFALGVFLSNLFVNTFLMLKPLVGNPVTYADYFKGSARNHLAGIAGGSIWCVGMAFSIIASDKAGTAISYGLASGAILVASVWGIYFWKEFKTAPRGTPILLNIMLLAFFAGLVLIVISR
jgi:glucose uptake protein